MSQILLTQFLIALYATTNGLRVVSYLPQIRRVARGRSGAKVIALSTWALWSISNFTTALYAFVVVGDGLLASISTFNTLSCVTVVALVIRERRRFAVEAMTLASRAPKSGAWDTQLE